MRPRTVFFVHNKPHATPLGGKDLLLCANKKLQKYRGDMSEALNENSESFCVFSCLLFTDDRLRGPTLTFPTSPLGSILPRPSTCARSKKHYRGARHDGVTKEL